MKPIESSLLPVCWRMISLWLKIWKLGRYIFQLKLLLHHFAALQRELKWFPKVYRISCHWSLAIPSRLNPVLLLQMDCSLHSSWLPTLISFVLLQLVGAPTIYYLGSEVLNAAIRLPLNHYGYDLMIWRTWLLKSFYEELLCFATGLFTSSSLVLLGYCIFLVTCLTLSRLIWNLTSAPFFELVIHKTRFNFFEKRWR